jgi:acyl-CoA synthetase (NDP forming)
MTGSVSQHINAEELLFRSPAPVLRAKSIAIVGASERGKWPATIYSNLQAFAYPGTVYPINPAYSEIWGVKCYPDFASLPEPPGHAVVIIPAQAVQAVLEEGVAAGLRSATVYADSFGEGADPAVVARGTALQALSKRSGLIVAGPNCMGSISLREKCFIYPNTELCKIAIGAVGAVFQSGGTLQFMCKSAADRGVKFSYMISSGNELCLDLADYVNFLVEDDSTKVIALFIEGIRRPQAFMAAAAKALAAGKPIIAIKTGKSQKSRDAAQSHTGAIAGDYAVYAAMCDRYGIVNCASLDDMLESMLAFQGGRLPKGPRVGFVTTSGGTVDLLYDYVEETGGITMPDFEPATKEKIQQLVKPGVKVKNPLDAGIPSGDRNGAEMCKLVVADPNVDMLAWAGTLPTGKGPRDAEALKSVLAATDKPVISFGRMHYMVGNEGIAFQHEVGFPFLQGLQPTVRALGALAFYAARAGRRIAPLPAPKGRSETVRGQALDAALRVHGLTPPHSAFAANPREAAAVAARIGFPVVLKLISPEISHKTEVGGVRLNLKSQEEVEQAAVALAASAGKAKPGARIDGFLVQEMVQGIEVIVGARTDPLYGPMIIVGAGGILVELVKDVAFHLLPIGAQEARDMIKGLKLSRLLDGFRGSAACDVDALINAICGLSEFYLDHRTWLSDLEVNPLIVLEKGQGVRAVDVRAVVVQQPFAGKAVAQLAAGHD